jgi:serine protease Do
MKKHYILGIVAALFAGIWMGANWHQFPFDVVADDILQSQTTAQPDSFPGSSGNVPESSAITFSVKDVIETLTSATKELMDKKESRSARELREDLDRTSVSIQLPKAATKPLSSQELYRNGVESVFLVAGLTNPEDDETDWATAFSTAFVVHEDGILCTSAHVFDHDDEDEAVVAMDLRGHVFPVVAVLASDKTSDTCLFRIAATGLKPLSLGETALPGTPIHVIGHPGDSFFYFSAGHVANYEHDPRHTLWMNVTADFGQGSSGGPVMDSAGNVVGQVSRTYTLYAGGDARNRRHSIRTRQAAPEKEEGKDDNEGESMGEDILINLRPDPQMVFKSCTPVSAIRALIK